MVRYIQAISNIHRELVHLKNTSADPFRKFDLQNNLGEWVHNQRKRRKKGKLDKERVDQVQVGRIGIPMGPTGWGLE